jgi:hypothetical protein
MINDITTVVSDTRALIALFDAIADLPSAHIGVQMHDDDGSLIKTLRAWASARSIELKRTTLTLDADNARNGNRWTWDQIRLCVGTNELVIHDNGSRRVLNEQEPVDADWSPAQTVAA